MYVDEINECIVNKWIHSSNTEVHKLCQLILRSPVTSSSVENSFSALKCMDKRLTTISQGQVRCINMSIEKDLLVERKANDVFYNNVTDDFSKKSHRVKFNYT